MKRSMLLLSLALCALCALCVFSACGGGSEPLPGTQADDTAAVPTEAPAETPTDAPATEPPVTQAPDDPTEAPSEAPTEPETEPVTHTVSFVTAVWESIPSVQLPEGSVLTAEAVALPEGAGFTDGKACGYLIPAGETFSGRFTDYTAVTLGQYTVTEDVTLALDIELRADDLSSLSDTAHINYYGRNYVTDEAVTFLNTASGFEVRFVGTQLTAVFTRRGPGPVGTDTLAAQPTLIRLRVYTEGDMDPEHSRVVVLDGSTDGREILLASFDTYGTHRVLIRKMNYDARGYAILTGLSCDGGFCQAPAKPGTKILVYGDSITVGFGVEYAAVDDSLGDVPEKEDGTRTWSVFFADRYGAEIQEYANTGVSIGVPCWREKTIMQEEYWHQYAYFDTGSRYDMTDYQPDLILCNLGTNDAGGLANGGTSFGNGSAYAPNDHYQPADLQAACADFITVMREYYPDAPIIFCYGMMATDPNVQNAIQKAMRASGDKNVYYCSMPLSEISTASGHPTLKGQADACEVLLKFVDRKDIRF